MKEWEAYKVEVCMKCAINDSIYILIFIFLQHLSNAQVLVNV